MKLTPTRSQQQQHHHHQQQLMLQSPSQFQYLQSQQSQQFPLTPLPTERGGVKIFTFLQGIHGGNNSSNTANNSVFKRAPSMTQYQIINLNNPPHKSTSTYMKPLQSPSTSTFDNHNLLNSNPPRDTLESQEPQQGLQKTATFSGLSQQLQGFSNNKNVQNTTDCLSNPSKLSITPRKANAKLLEKTITSPFFSSNKQQQQAHLSQQQDNYPKINPFIVNSKTAQAQQFNSSFYNFYSQNQLQNDLELAQKQQNHQMLIQQQQQQEQQQSSTNHSNNGQLSYSSINMVNHNQQQQNCHSYPLVKGTSSSCDKSISSKVYSSSQFSSQQPALDKNSLNIFQVSNENIPKNNNLHHIDSKKILNLSSTPSSNNNTNIPYLKTNDIPMSSQHQIKKFQQPQLSNIINKSSEWQQQTQITSSSNPSQTPKHRGNTEDVINQKQEQQQPSSYKSQNLFFQHNNQQFQQQAASSNANQQQQQCAQIVTSQLKQELPSLKDNISSISSSSKKLRLQSQALEEAIWSKQRCASQNVPSTPSSSIVSNNTFFHKTNNSNNHAAFLNLNKYSNNNNTNTAQHRIIPTSSNENNSMPSNQQVSLPCRNQQDSSHNKKQQQHHRPQLLLSASAITPFIQNFVDTGMTNNSTATTPTNIIFIDKHVGSITTTIVNSNSEGNKNNNNPNRKDIRHGKIIHSNENKETINNSNKKQIQCNNSNVMDSDNFKLLSSVGGVVTKNKSIKGNNVHNLDEINQQVGINNHSNSDTKKAISNSLKKRKCCSVEKARNISIGQRQQETQLRGSEKLNGIDNYDDKEQEEEDNYKKIKDYVCQAASTKWEEILDKNVGNGREICNKKNNGVTNFQEKENSIHREIIIQHVQSEGNQQQQQQILPNNKQSFDDVQNNQTQIEEQYQWIQQQQDLLNQREMQVTVKECQLRELEKALILKEKQLNGQQVLSDMVKRKLANIELSVEQLQANSLRLNEERDHLEEKLAQANNTVSIYQQQHTHTQKRRRIRKEIVFGLVIGMLVFNINRLNSEMKKQNGGEVHEQISLAIALVQKLSDELSVTRQQQIQAVIERDQAIKERDRAIQEKDQQLAFLKNDRNQRLLERQSISMLRYAEPDESFVVTLELPTEHDIISQEQQQQQQQQQYIFRSEHEEKESIEICQQQLQNSEYIDENFQENHEIIQHLHGEEAIVEQVKEKEKINSDTRIVSAAGKDCHSTLESLIAHQQQQQLAYQKLTQSINQTLARQVQQQQQLSQKQSQKQELQVQIKQPIKQGKQFSDDWEQLQMQQAPHNGNQFLSQILSLNASIPQNFQSTRHSNSGDDKQFF